MPLISVITPCFNEQDNVREIYLRVKAVFEELPGYQYEHIFIDNASGDSTVEILKEIAETDKNVKIIVNARNFGHIRSPYYAMLQARGDAIVSIVADLKDPPEIVRKKVFQAVTDPARIHPNDPGHPDICTVFAYHRVFNETEVPEIEESCRLGKLRCVDCKANLASVLNRFLEPIRNKRSQFEQRTPLVWEILEEGTKKAKAIGQETLCQVKKAMGLSYFLKNASKKAFQETLSG